MSETRLDMQFSRKVFERVGLLPCGVTTLA